MRYLATCCSAMPAVLTAKVTALGLSHSLSSPLHWRSTPALDCWHSHSQEYSSTFSAETAALRERSTESQPGQAGLNADPRSGCAIHLEHCCAGRSSLWAAGWGLLRLRRLERWCDQKQDTKPYFFVWQHKVSQVCTMDTAPHRPTALSTYLLKVPKRLNTAGLADFFHLHILFKETTS